MKELFKDKRSQRIAVIAHCILNQNSRASGLAERPCAIDEIIETIFSNEVGVIQMPCPELSYIGLPRKQRTKDQYDTPIFRGLCKQIAEDVADQIQKYANCGVNTEIIIGVDGSPSCGVNETSKPDPRENITKQERKRNSGILIAELKSKLKEKEILIPFIGVNYHRLSFDVAKIKSYLTAR